MLNMVENYQVKNSTTLSKTINYSIGIVIVLLFWIILSEVKDNSIVYPKINEIIIAMGSIVTDSEFLFGALNSVFRVIIVLIISLIISMIVTFLYILKKDTLLMFKPLISILKAAPLAIISVYLWISLGSENAPYLITLLMVLPVAIEGFIAAINEIDKSYIDQLKTENVSIIKKFFKIYIPLIMPYIIMTMLQTFGMGLKVMLMGEYICQTTSSIGQYIYFLKNDFYYDKLLAILIFVVIIVIIIEVVIKIISNKLLDKENVE